MKNQIRTLEFWDAFTTGYIEGLLFQMFEISEEKSLNYYVINYKDGWALCFEWKVGYISGASGTWDSAPEDNEDKTDEQTFYFSFNENPEKVKREILEQLETIADLPNPEDIELEADEPDFEED